MAKKAMIDKSIVKLLKTSDISPIRAKQIIKALHTIDTSSMNIMRVTGKVKKISVDSHVPMYMYRVNLKDRIIFSELDDRRIIHKLIDLD